MDPTALANAAADAKLLGQLLTLAFVAIGLLMSVIGWFLRKDYSRMETGLERANERITVELKNEREARAKDRHDLRTELHAEVMARHAFEVTVAKEYVNHDRLMQALAPMNENIARLSRISGEIFEKLDQKQDKK